MTNAELDAMAVERIRLFWGGVDPDASRLRELLVDFGRQVILRVTSQIGPCDCGLDAAIVKATDRPVSSAERT
jgi:hypothetical protein